MMKYLLSVSSLFFWVGYVFAADSLVEINPVNNKWSVKIAGQRGGTSAELYEMVHSIVEEEGLEKPVSSTKELATKKKCLVESLTYKDIGISLQVENLLDPNSFVYELKFDLDPSTYGYSALSLENSPRAIHVFGPPAATLARVLARFRGVDFSNNRARTYGSGIFCEQVHVMGKERYVCEIALYHEMGESDMDVSSGSSGP